MKRILKIMVLLMFALKVNAQEPIFFQYFMNPVYMNPALSGVNDGARASYSYRNQWSFVPSDLVTKSISFDTWVPGPGSFSISHLKNVEGEGSLESNYTALGYAYRFNIKNTVKMQIGLQYQRTVRTIDWSKFVFTDNLDPVHGHVYSTAFISPESIKYNIDNFNFGSVLVISPKLKRMNRCKQYYQMGFSINNLIERNNYGFISHNFNLARKYSFHMQSYLNPFTYRSSLEAIHIPILIQLHGKLKTYQLGAEVSQALNNYDKGTGLIGIAYRIQNTSTKLGDRIGPSEALFFRVQYGNVNKVAKYTVSLSYGFTLSELSQRSSHGIYELSIIIESRIKGKVFGKLKDKQSSNKKNKNSMRCPFTDAYVF